MKPLSETIAEEMLRFEEILESECSGLDGRSKHELAWRLTNDWVNLHLQAALALVEVKKQSVTTRPFVS